MKSAGKYVLWAVAVLALGSLLISYLANQKAMVFNGVATDTTAILVANDRCPNTPSGVPIDEDGCPLDEDYDSVPDYLDACPATPPGVPVDPHGCEVDQGATDGVDADGDGVPDARDLCASSPVGQAVDEDGCPILGMIPTNGPDSDGDGVADVDDGCPNTRAMAGVDEEGCSNDQLVDRMPTGTYAFNVPASIRSASTRTVILRLEPAPGLDAADVRDSTVQHLRSVTTADITDSITVEERPFSRRMEATLIGPASWSIVPRAGSAGIRSISELTPTEWIWDVTAACRRPTRLSVNCKEEVLSLAVIAHFGDSGFTWRVLDERIDVRVSLGQVLASLVADNWQWFLATIFIPLIIYGWKRRRDRRVVLTFIAANPDDQPHLDQGPEIEAIKQAIRESPNPKAFAIEQHWAVQATGLPNLIKDDKPQIVHFSGHGTPNGELVLEGKVDTPFGTAPRGEPLSQEELHGVFGNLDAKVRLVVLSACFSETQAQAIASEVEAVVGVHTEIGDKAAIAFSTAFYGDLARGRSVKAAFHTGCNAIDLAGLEDRHKPRLIPDHGPESITFVKTKDK